MFLFFLFFLTNTDFAGSHNFANQVLTEKLKSEKFSENRSDFGSSRQSFWHQNKLSSLKIEKVGFFYFLFLFLTNTEVAISPIGKNIFFIVCLD